MKLTYDDFVHFPDDGRRHELIDGEHYVTPSPNITHQRISGMLSGLTTLASVHTAGLIRPTPCFFKS